MSIADKLDPWFITGFVDAEGCFSIGIYKNKTYQIGCQVQPIFLINLHNKDFKLLSSFQSYFGGGKIRKYGKTSISFRITSLKKWEIVLIFLTTDGFKEILSIKVSMNLGLPKSLITVFPNISPIIRPKVMDNNIKNPHWIAGFTDGEGEGCFFLYVVNSFTTKLGETVRIKFQITQHARDGELM